MPVLPSVTWSTAVRLPAVVLAVLQPESAQGDNNAVPARTAEFWMNWRRLRPWRFMLEFFMDESFQTTGGKLFPAAR
jgi:hypothetical protein